MSSFTSPQSLTLDTSKNHATQHKKAQVDLAFLRVCCFSPILSPLLVRYFLLLLDMPPSPQNPMTIPANHSLFSVPSLPFLFFSFAILDLVHPNLDFQLTYALAPHLPITTQHSPSSSHVVGHPIARLLDPSLLVCSSFFSLSQLPHALSSLHFLFSHVPSTISRSSQSHDA